MEAETSVSKRYRFSIRKKIVLGVSTVAVITFASSAIILYFLADFFASFLNIDPAWLTLLVLLAGVVWSGILGYFLSNIITKPLAQLEQAVTEAAAGVIDQTVELSKSDDELRALGVAYNKMLTNLNGMVREIDRNFVETDERVQQLGIATATSSSQAEQIGFTMGEIASGAENAAQAIQETVFSLETTTEMANEMQEKASLSSKQASEMGQLLETSRVMTTNLVKGIGDLTTKQEHSLDSVHRLEEQAQEVEGITAVVGAIAKQTNLLALNASIEASRAGEHGRGFAVVASEVRKLADESTQAVESINQLITTIQEEVKQVVKNIEEQVDVARIQTEQGEKTTTALLEMESSAKTVTDIIEIISTLSDKQKQSIEASSVKTEEVAAIAEQTSAGAQEVTAMTEEQTVALSEIETLSKDLSNQAKELKTTIEKFTIESNQ
ncbi:MULTISPECIES: methyl-accepting chemotaxis protein [Shouchella]|uniref:Methyl-accepting chemotaxis protein n=2 Tax=Shouchella TaxID=2893057 RepID=A0ABY7WBR2_9BACI|nr:MULTISPECIES: methyl-accepting chemotaxis protein [Shouchella]MED4128298.1 methyl-accepting chemotaxis protein [Shouchella miscanthi]WDF05069.1 methyl-accepting chemotaxis protein [Shouchella hunanensis]